MLGGLLLSSLLSAAHLSAAPQSRLQPWPCQSHVQLEDGGRVLGGHNWDWGTKTETSGCFSKLNYVQAIPLESETVSSFGEKGLCRCT